MKGLVSILALCLLVAVGVRPAGADVRDGQGDIFKPTGTVGNAVSAALQTRGLELQSDILKKFGSGQGGNNFFGHMGGLLYAGAIAGAVMSVALFGNYRTALYLLFGPGIFWFVLDNRVTARPVPVKYGNDQRQDVGQQVIFRIMNGDPNREVGEVAWLFTKWDKVVSSVVDAGVSLLVNEDNKEHLVTSGTERMFQRLTSIRSTDPGFLQMLSVGMMSLCGDATKEAQQEALAQMRGDTRTKAEREQAKKDRMKLPVELPEETVAYLRAKKALGIQVVVPPEGKTILTCDELWRNTVNIAKKHADDIRQDARNPEKSDPGGENDIPWERVVQRIETVAGEGFDPSTFLAGIYITNSLRSTTHGAMTGQIWSRVPFNEERADTIFGIRTDAEAEGLFMTIAAYAHAVPYVQGVLLFLLTATFPLFCFFLILPGRVSSFFNWFYLWMWVKSWDIGFASIDAVREFLFLITGRRAGFNSDDSAIVPGGRDLYNVTTLFSGFNFADPIASLNTHNVIVGTLYMAVPVVTAHFCLGASNLYDAFKTSLDGNAERFGMMRRAGALRRLASPAESKIFKDVHGFALKEAMGEFKKVAPQQSNGPVTQAATALFGGNRLLGTAAGYLAQAGIGRFDRNSGVFALGDNQLPRRIHEAYNRGLSRGLLANSEDIGRLAAFARRRSTFSGSFVSNLSSNQQEDHMREFFQGTSVEGSSYRGMTATESAVTAGLSAVGLGGMANYLRNAFGSGDKIIPNRSSPGSPPDAPPSDQVKMTFGDGDPEPSDGSGD